MREITAYREYNDII